VPFKKKKMKKEGKGNRLSKGTILVPSCKPTTNIAAVQCREQLCSQGRVIAGLGALRDLPQLPYLQGCGSSLVAIARQSAAQPAGTGVVLNRLTDPRGFGIFPLNTHIPLSAVTDAIFDFQVSVHRECIFKYNQQVATFIYLLHGAESLFRS
jgi:hypothetical protein